MITLIDLLIVFVIGLLFVLYFTDQRLFIYNRSIVLSKDTNNFITLHFLHGHFPKGKWRDFYKHIDNKKGGSVSMQIDDSVYAFEVKEGKYMHLEGADHREHFNALFSVKNILIWELETKDSCVTSVKIPVTEQQKQILRDTYKSYLAKTPYDYAFFGMGSASAVYEVLAKAGIVLTQDSLNRYVLNAFNPRIFRKRVILWAEFNGFDVFRKEGSADVYWEK